MSPFESLGKFPCCKKSGCNSHPLRTLNGPMLNAHARTLLSLRSRALRNLVCGGQARTAPAVPEQMSMPGLRLERALGAARRTPFATRSVAAARATVHAGALLLDGRLLHPLWLRQRCQVCSVHVGMHARIAVTVSLANDCHLARLSSRHRRRAPVNDARALSSYVHARCRTRPLCSRQRSSACSSSRT